MGTTTKMAIPYPEATGLVKDGWEDMKDIATQVDAKSGLVLLNTTTFSGVATQSINDVFSTNYNNYRIIGSDLQSTTDGDDLQIRLRVSGSDNTNNEYRYGRYYVGSYASQGAGNTNNNITSVFALVQTSSSVKNSFAADIYSPFLTSNTAYTATGSGKLLDYYAGVMTVTTSYTGFTLRGVGTLSGTLSVYGYNK